MAEFIKFGFISGVLAPGYVNRTDLEKFDLGLIEGTNWFVDYGGGLATRPGTEFCDFIMFDGQNVVTIPFQFGFDIENTYEVMFGPEYIRFVQDGAYVLEPPQTVTDVTANVIEIVGHGYADGDWLKVSGLGSNSLENRTVVVAFATTDTFEITDTEGVPLLVTDWTSGGEAARIYTLDSPFTSAQIPKLRAHQIRDSLRITSSNGVFFPYSLTRVASDDWTLEQISFDNGVATPTGLTGEGDPVDSLPGSSVLYTVTAVSKEGEESLAADPVLIEGMRDFTVTDGYATITWDAQDDVAYFNVYRSIVSKDDTLTRAQQLGFVGRAYGPVFTDNNIIPDFTVSAPLRNNPFAHRAITSINITAPGSGYDNTSIVTVADPDGTGFSGYPVVYDGELLAIVVVNGGSGYTSPTVSVDVGTGATFDVSLSPGSGNNPYVGTVFQQRQIFAGSRNKPITVFGSKVGLYNNFDISQIIVESDSYEYEIDSAVVAPIQHLVPTKAGLLVTTAVGMWQLLGTNNGPVTPTDASFDKQSFNGVAEVPPLEINEDIVILDAEYTSVRLLGYSDFNKNYVSNDISILSNQYFDNSNRITSWAFLNSPHRLIQSVRADGKIISGCVIKEHNIYAWCDWETKGFFRHISKLRENEIDRAYVIVERNIGGTYRKYLERFTSRKFKMVEELNCLDSALQLPATYPDIRVMPEMLTDTIAALRTTGATFTAGDVGKVFRGGGARGEVVTYVSPTEVNVDLDRPFTRFVHGTTTVYDLRSGEWTLDTPVSEITGLWHLEGQTVNALLDGNVFKDLTVTDGTLTFEEPFSRASVGLPYVCQGRSLVLSSPKAVIEDNRNRLTGVGVWQHESRGLKMGTRLSKLYELKERTNEPMAAAQALQSGLSFMSFDPVWEVGASFYFRQDNPLPASLLGWIVEAEIGDDDDG